MKIYVGSPIYRNVEMRYHGAIIRLERLVASLPDVELAYGYVPGDADVGRARSIAASNFLREAQDCDVMLTIDSDIWFMPEEAVSLCRKAVEGYDCIGALYMVRSIRERQPAPLIGTDKVINLDGSQEPVEIVYLATGFMAVSRPVVEKVSQSLPLCMQSTASPFWPMYLQMVIPWEGDEWLYLSEDYAFCHRVREAGYKVWLDPSIRLGHVGQYEYRLEDLLTEFPKPMPIRLTQRDGHVEVEGFPIEEEAQAPA